MGNYCIPSFVLGLNIQQRTKEDPCPHEPYNLEERKTLHQWSHYRVKTVHGKEDSEKKEWRALSTVWSKEASPGKKDKKELTRRRQAFYTQKTAHPKLLKHCPTNIS